MRPSPLRLALAAFLVLPLGLATGCDAYDDDDDDEGSGTEAGVVAVTFEYDTNAAEVLPNIVGGTTATYRNDDILDEDDQADVAAALDGANDGDVAVLLFAEDDLFLGFEGGGGDTDRWAALPRTEAFESIDVDDVPYVDLTLGYEFSYDDADLYFDVTSSAPELEIEEFLRGRVNDPDDPDDRPIRMRLVVVANDVFAGAEARGVDFQSYEAVRRAFALPE